MHATLQKYHNEIFFFFGKPREYSLPIICLPSLLQSIYILMNIIKSCSTLLQQDMLCFTWKYITLWMLNAVQMLFYVVSVKSKLMHLLS